LPIIFAAIGGTFAALNVVLQLRRRPRLRKGLKESLDLLQAIQSADPSLVLDDRLVDSLRAQIGAVASALAAIEHRNTFGPQPKPTIDISARRAVRIGLGIYRQVAAVAAAFGLASLLSVIWPIVRQAWSGGFTSIVSGHLTEVVVGSIGLVSVLLTMVVSRIRRRR
jgi:hypothetical protein